MNSRQSAHGGSNVPRLKPTGKTFFVSERHKALHRSTVNLLLHTCSKAAALPFLSHPHMLRHACAFALADQGADTRLIQDCLGNRGATLPFMSDLGKVHYDPTKRQSPVLSRRFAFRAKRSALPWFICSDVLPSPMPTLQLRLREALVVGF